MCALDGLRNLVCQRHRPGSSSHDSLAKHLETQRIAAAALAGFARSKPLREYIGKAAVLQQMMQCLSPDDRLKEIQLAIAARELEGSSTYESMSQDEGADQTIGAYAGQSLEHLQLPAEITFSTLEACSLQLALIAVSDESAAAQLKSAGFHRCHRSGIEFEFAWDRAWPGLSILTKLIHARSPSSEGLDVDGGQLKDLEMIPAAAQPAVADASLQVLYSMLASGSITEQEDAASLLREVAADGSGLQDAEALASLCIGLESASLSVQMDAAWLLGRAALSQASRQQLVQLGCLQPLLKLSQLDSAARAAARLAEQAVALLTYLAGEELAARKMMELDGIPCIVRLLSSSSSTTGVQAQAASCVSALCSTEAAKVKILECGGVAALRGLLSSPSQEVQDHATHALAELLAPAKVGLPSPGPAGDAHGSAASQKAAPTASSFQPATSNKIMQLMEQLALPGQEDSSRVSVAHAILQLAQSPANRALLAQQNRLEPLIDLLHTPDGDLQQLGAAILSLLAVNGETALAIAHADAVDPLKRLVATRSSPARLDAAVALCLVLAGVNDYLDFEELRAYHSASLQQVMTAGRSRSAKQQLQSATVIAQVARHHVYRFHVTTTEGLPMLLKLLRASLDNIDAQQIPTCILAAISAMTVLPSASRALHEEGIIPLLLQCVGGHHLKGTSSAATTNVAYQNWNHVVMAVFRISVGSPAELAERWQVQANLGAFACLGLFPTSVVQRHSSCQGLAGTANDSAAEEPTQDIPILQQVVEKDGIKPLLGLLGSPEPLLQAQAA